MALLHRATITPTKGELVAGWLPDQVWAPAAPIASGVSCRLDDPAGEVGLEVFLLTDEAGLVVQVPLTYRAEPFEAGRRHLLGTMQHSVLGARWVYDGCGDPVFVAALATTIATGGTEAQEWVELESGLQQRDPQLRIAGSGTTSSGYRPEAAADPRDDGTRTTIAGTFGELIVLRHIGEDADFPLTLRGSWGEGPAAAVLAGLRPG